MSSAKALSKAKLEFDKLMSSNSKFVICLLVTVKVVFEIKVNELHL